MDALANPKTLPHLNGINSIKIWQHKKLHETNISLQNERLGVLLSLFMTVQWLISIMRLQFSWDIKCTQHFITHQWKMRLSNPSTACQLLFTLQYATSHIQKSYSHHFQDAHQMELLWLSLFWSSLDPSSLLWQYKHASISASTLFGNSQLLRLKRHSGIHTEQLSF